LSRAFFELQIARVLLDVVLGGPDRRPSVVDSVHWGSEVDGRSSAGVEPAGRSVAGRRVALVGWLLRC
jgi:hypothetical protein